MGTRTMSRVLIRLLLVQFIFAIALFVMGYWYWLLNFELAFFSALLIILGSFSGYRRMVKKRLGGTDIAENTDELILQKLEDPYDLYDDERDEEKVEIINPQEVNLADVVKEEKLRLKQNKQTLKKTIKSTPGIFSPWRFIPYIILVLSFIALNNNHILEIPAFLIGLGLGIASAVIIGKKWINGANS